MAEPLNSALEEINQSFKEKALQEEAKNKGIPYVDVAHQPINPDLLTIITLKEVQELQALPFRQIGNKVNIAAANPESEALKAVVRDLETNKHLQIKLFLASREGIKQSIKPFLIKQQNDPDLPVKSANIDKPSKVLNRKEQIAVLNKLGTELHELGESTESLAKLEQGAVAVNASDAHFQPEGRKVMLRFRIDGVLQNIAEIDRHIYDYFATQIKHKSDMKINVSDVPQDGRYSFSSPVGQIDVRVSAIPTANAESIVLRFLRNDHQLLDLAELGYSENIKTLLVKAQKYTQGMIVVTGPTGSGKTTTLYTLLNDFNTRERKIITLEDPVEYQLPGVVQSPINKKEGYTFAKGLEAILRQDPDVIMVGEIRDQATAETAAQAALTGHVVLCTLHTNNAIQSIPRLLNMGVQPFIAGPALRTIVAQRLVRKLCDSCKQAYKPTKPEIEFLNTYLPKGKELSGEDNLYKSVGCSKCHNTGFTGRTVIAEGFIIDTELAAMISNQATELEIKSFLENRGEGQTMYHDAALKVVNGITTLAEMQRSLGES